MLAIAVSIVLIALASSGVISSTRVFASWWPDRSNDSCNGECNPLGSRQAVL